MTTKTTKERILEDIVAEGKRLNKEIVPDIYFISKKLDELEREYIDMVKNLDVTTVAGILIRQLCVETESERSTLEIEGLHHKGEPIGNYKIVIKKTK